jgi:UDP-2,3-diacylglucosamine hydrolase
VARFSSAMSKEMSDESQNRLESIMEQFAQGKFNEGYDAVILGHCHKAFLREEMHDGKQRTFALLGDWLHHHSYLTCDGGRFSLHRFLAGE